MVHMAGIIMMKMTATIMTTTIQATITTTTIQEMVIHLTAMMTWNDILKMAARTSSENHFLL